MPEILINSIDSMEPDHLVRTMVEFGSKAPILSHRVGSLYRREVNEGNREKLEDLQEKVDKFAEERAVWKKDRKGWEEEKKRLGTWKVRCLDSETKLNGRIANLEVDYDELKEKYEGVEVELEDLKSCIIQEHINGFQKGVRQATFFCQDIDAADPRFDVNKGMRSSPEEEVEKTTGDEDMNTGEAVEGDNNKAAYGVVFMIFYSQ